MNRGRRYQQSKPFVSGGIYNAQAQQYQHSPQQEDFSHTTRSQSQYQRNAQQATPQKAPQEEQTKLEEAPEPPILSQYNNGNDSPSNVSQDQSVDMDDSSELTDKNGKMRFKKIFLNRKKSSVRSREKKIRQNRQLRKAIMPKNALMALNEVKGIEMSDFVLNSNASGGFSAIVTVNNSQYEGKGNSKASAKNDACEKALRDYVIAKMLRRPRKIKTNSESAVELMDEDDANDDAKSDKNSVCNDDPDDVPMVNLASFALFKLFSEWENAGYVVPEMHPSAAANGENNGASTAKEPKKLPVRNELPSNWESMHPATLLCVMRPGIIYTECEAFGEKPNLMQKMSVNVDDQEFYGTGRSKKIARRNAAVAVCNSLFGTNFNFDTTVESA